MAFGLSAGAIGLIGAGAAVAGGAIAASGAKSAAKTQAQAEQDANATNLQMFNTQVGLNAPFREAGLSANNRLSYLLGLTPQNPGSVAGSPQPLTQGADGVFTPSANGSFDEQAYLRANPDVAQYIQSHPPGSVGYTTPLQHYQTFGQQEGRSLGLSPTPTQTIQQTPGQAGQAPTLGDFGSLNAPFGADQFAADSAPKAPALDLYGGAQNLSGFQDMPAFNPDMMKEDPGYQFRLDQGMKGVNNSAAAKGGLLSGAALKATDRYNQDYASGEYGNAFNRYQTTRGNNLQDYLTNRDTSQLNNTNGLQTYATNLGTQQANRSNALGDYTGAFDRYQTSRSNVINPLLSMMGYGQQATAGTSSAAQNYGAQATSAITGAGNAAAAGQVGAANAINSGLSGAANNFQQNQLMNLLLSRQPAGTPSTFANSPMSSSLLFSNGSLGD